MTVNIRNLCFATAILIATSSAAHSARVSPPRTNTPPMANSNNVLYPSDLHYDPIAGKKTKPQLQVLEQCRVKYSQQLDVTAVWTSYARRTGWWCTYKPKT